MAKYQIDDIKIIIADPNRQLRNSLKGVLHQYGFRGIIDASTLKGLEEEIRISVPDLILCDYDLEEGGVCQLIKRLRHNKLGQNPFAAAILFIEEANEKIVRDASEAGFDDIQIKPVVAQNIIDRVTSLIKKRKPFVVTTDYVGPDRRSSLRPGTMEIPVVEVPNTLASKALGNYDPREVQRHIDETQWNINAQKIERHIFQVGYLIERIVPAYNEGAINKETLGMVVRMVQVAQDIIVRLKDSDYAHVADLATTLAKVARALWESGSQPKRKDLNLLPELSAALTAAINVQGSSIEAAQKISSSIREKY
jgi:DNA-binding NarL/FixJ family response regulator